jgi:hypothetical protein
MKMEILSRQNVIRQRISRRPGRQREEKEGKGHGEARGSYKYQGTFLLIFATTRVMYAGKNSE